MTEERAHAPRHPSAAGNRRFGVAVRLAGEHASNLPVGVLDAYPGGFRFQYVQAVLEQTGFRPLLSFPETGVTYESSALFPFFAQRIMDAGRPDYPQYLSWLSLDTAATPLDVLARSNGRRKGDRYHLCEAPTIGRDGDTAAIFLVTGMRHSPASHDDLQADLAGMHPGEELTVEHERTNIVNEHALLLRSARGVALGWVPDLLIDYVDAMSVESRRVAAYRINGDDCPWHLRLVAEVRGQVVSAYAPFQVGRWLPVGQPSSAMALAPSL